MAGSLKYPASPLPEKKGEAKRVGPGTIANDIQKKAALSTIKVKNYEGNAVKNDISIPGNLYSVFRGGKA